MKREELKTLMPEATDEVINQIMAMNGADITKAKGDSKATADQLKATQSQLAELQAKNNQDALTQAQAQSDALKAELEAMKKAESVRGIRAKVSEEKGIPVNLLTAETEDECNSQADAIIAFAKPSKYPNLPDGGETSGGTGGGNNVKKFYDFFNQNL